MGSRETHLTTHMTESSLEEGSRSAHPLMPIQRKAHSSSIDSPTTAVETTAPSTMRTRVGGSAFLPNDDGQVLERTTSPEQRRMSRRTSGPPRSTSVLTRISSMMVPAKRVGPTPTLAASLKAIVFSSWLNVLLVFIPISWALHHTITNDTAIFVTCFFAIIPLAKLLGFATEELAIRVGQTMGGLLNATLGNAVELIISIVALIKCELRVVQASLVGSILSNLLLVLGMCFFAGGMRFSEQGFMVGASQLNSSLLTLSVVALLIPATFHAAINTNNDSISNEKEGQDLLKMSHGVAIIMIFIYGAMLFFQLWSHAHLYDEKGAHAEIAPPSIRYPPKAPKVKKGDAAPTVQESSLESPVGQTDVPGVNPPPTSNEVHAADDEEEEIPQISVWAAVILLVVVTVLIAFTAEYLVGSISGLVENSPVSEEWVGLILLPIVGNAAEHLTAVTVSVKDKLDLSIGVAVGSSIQIALLVIPLITILAWILGKPLTLLFDPFESAVLFLSVITVNYVVADGKSNWLEGMILMSLYVLIATALWFYPGSDPAATLLTCT